MNRTASSRPVRRFLAPLVLTSVVALGATGCSDNSDGSGSSATSAGDDAQAALDAGLEAHAAGDLTTAAAKYDETLELDPTNKFAYYNLALIDEASSNYGLAEQKYRQAIAADPAYEPALFNLAILVTSSDPQEAVSLYQRAVAADKRDASAWMNLGLLLRASGEKAEGNQAVATAIKLNPELTDPAPKS
jgi:tetratricopeptide (TPR) repeat protein